MAENFKLLESEKVNLDNFLEFVNKEASAEDKQFLDELLKLIGEEQLENRARAYYGNSSLIATVKRIYRNAIEAEKVDAERKPGYQERDQENLVNRIKSLDYSFDARVDKEIFLDRLKNYANIDNSYRRPVYSELLGLENDFEETKNIVEEIYSS